MTDLIVHTSPGDLVVTSAASASVGLQGPIGLSGAGLTPLGPYDAGVDYEQDSLVRVGNKQWASKTAVPAGNTPAENAYWTIFFDGEEAQDDAQAFADAAEGYRDEAEDFKNAAASTAAAIDTAGAARLSQIIAALPNKTYNSTADALSFGLAGGTVGAGGSGATTPGDYDVPATNGGGTQGILRVRVASGAITAILGVTAPGKSYTSNPTTWDFSAIAGLTGATITSSRTINQPVGTWFNVFTTATGLFELFEVTSAGVATTRGVYSLVEVVSGLPSAVRHKGKLVENSAATGINDRLFINIDGADTYAALVAAF